MNKLYFLAAVILMGTVSVFAQDWVESSDSGAEYNCELVSAIIEEYGDRPYARENGAVQTFAEFHAICAAADDADTQTAATDFKVTVNQNVNLREGAGTSFSRVGQAKAGEILEVVAEDGDWYEVKFERGTAFIAGWLTTRLPDVVIETNEPHAIMDLGCIVVPDSSRGNDMDISFVIAGERHDDVIVDLYRPNEENPLRVDRQLDKTFIDTGDVYILQVYRWNQWFPTGIYTIEVKLDRKSYKMAWNVTERAEYNVHVYCE